MTAPATDIAARIASRRDRIHILTGAVCNNNCVFCMEDDRDARHLTNSATTDDTVRWILAANPGCEEVCFTSGEPTTNPRLGHWARMARQAGVPRVSVMTNGRALSYERYAKALVAAGMNRFYVSIHGHDARLHESLTRTPSSFAQTVAGIGEIARLRRYGVELHTSTVLTRRNLGHLTDIYRFLRRLGVDQIVFNVMQANGRADTYFEQIFPRYSDIAAAAARFLDEERRRIATTAAGLPTRSPTDPPAALPADDPARIPAFFVDIPLCTTGALPDFNRGYVESYTHYEPAVAAAQGLAELVRDEAERTARTVTIPSGIDPSGTDPSGTSSSAAAPSGTSLVQIRRADLDDARRRKRPACAACRYDAVCEGVWGNYLRRHGWDELVPVPPAR